MKSKLCPRCNSEMQVIDLSHVYDSSATAVMDSINYAPSASGIGMPVVKKYNYVCDNCGHTETNVVPPLSHS